MDGGVIAEIVEQLNEIILEITPDAQMLDKYGGTMVEMDPGQPESQYCGYFVYQNHLSLEFAKGIRLDDPTHILEGAGQQRRHIKLRDPQDVTDKRCKDFLVQASKL